MTQRPSRLLFVRNADLSFIRIDRDILREKWDVTDRYERSPRVVRPAALYRAVTSHDLVVCWFASWHSVLPIVFAHLLRKPSALIIGGYDIANLPAIGYGHQRGGVRRWASRLSIHWARQLLTNSYYSQDEAVANVGIARHRVQVVHHGIPDPGVPPNPPEREHDLVLTVGHVHRSNLQRKGLLPFVKAAALLPDCRFHLVGQWLDDAVTVLQSSASANVTLRGRVSDEELDDAYRQASVYVQASVHEGFGMAVAEAMIRGCIPVVTRAGSLPEVVGDCGVYAASQSPADVAQGIKEALAWPATAGQRARERVLAQFPIERRRQALHQLVERLLA